MLNLTQDLLQRYGSTSIQQLTGQKHLTAFVHPTFYFYPSSSLFTACFQDPSSYQLLDVVHSCRAGSHYTCRTPDRYLWWDDWHPTTHAQQIIAESVYSTVKAL
ncbi:hypothetical protein BDF14DRAFT_142981 [Spinellus fusiger]|nr:hypothetical protein BDF14DRAFT_142981 [Spinellus fusiger]